MQVSGVSSRPAIPACRNALRVLLALSLARNGYRSDSGIGSPHEIFRTRRLSTHWCSGPVQARSNCEISSGPNAIFWLRVFCRRTSVSSEPTRLPRSKSLCGASNQATQAVSFESVGS